MSAMQPPDTSSLLARLGDAHAFELTILERRALSPALLEISLVGAPEAFVPAPGQDVMVSVPVDGGDGTFRRRYSVRRHDPEAGAVDLWIDLAAGGPGARWASDAAVGSSIAAIGPRGKITLDPLADWHLFIGDLSFLGAAYAMAEAIEPPGQALFVFEIAHEADAVVPELDEGIGVTVCFIERAERPLGDPAGLLAGLAALELPADLGHAYVGGEMKVVASVRRALTERGLAPEAIEPKSYWRLGVANMAHGEPARDDG
jgi:NADPH-dependent ferric siderophore reductase